MDPKAVIFDLDMTLVDSSRLELARDAAAKNPDLWPRIYQRLDEIRPFVALKGPSADQIPAALRARGVKVAVVTRSPTWYATRVLERFGIEHDTLVSYNDVLAQKPSPEPFNLALSRLGVGPNECLSIGDDPDDAQAAYHARIPSIGALWRFAPDYNDPRLKDFWRASPERAILLPSMLLRPDLLEGCRYVGEAILEGSSYHQQVGRRLFWRDPATGDRFECLGRYFQGADPRGFRSHWSQLIIKGKNDHAAEAGFAPALASFLNGYDWKPNTIMPIPPKPGQASRFGELLSAVLPMLETPCMAQVDGLVCLREIPGYKDLDHDARERAIRGSIGTRYRWDGKRVVVVDDVMSSGATARESSRILRAAGAEDVRIVALGVTQEVFFRKICPRCNRSMVRRPNGTTGVLFWGCSGFRSKACRFTLPLDPNDPV